MKRNAKLHPTTLICGGVVFLLVICSLGAALRSPSTNEFRLHRARYEQIIARVKEMGIQPYGKPHLWMSSDLDPTTLSRKRTNNEDMVGMVEVYRAETNGAYMILITTKDMGHLGTFGYGYSDALNNAPTVTPWERQQQLDSHWYIMENRSW